MAKQYDLIVIGAGPGGYESAIEASKKGMKTAVVEARELGGTCLNRGCIPTKTIMHATELYRELGNCESLGIHVKDAAYDIGAIQARKDEVLGKLRDGIGMLMKKHKIDVYHGVGTIVSEHTVHIQGEESEDISGEFILIATGSVPAVPPIPGSDLENVITSDELLDKSDGVYDRLVIIGGGVIGMEFASIYSSLNCKVTVIEAMDRILANMDKEIAQNLKMILKKRGVDIHAGAKVEEIRQGENKTLVCCYTEKEEKKEVEADGILIAVGRRANTSNLCGTKIELHMNRGQIVVNDTYQTNYENIYAIGDVIGGIQLAHTATAEGLCAVAHMNKEQPPVDMKAVPGCVYTDPEIASVGFTLEEAKAKDMPVTSRKYVMSANGKTVLSGQERGFIKVVAEEGSGKIVGAQMMCARATDMISEFATAIVNGLTLADMASVIRPHPTFSEAITEAVKS